MVKRMRKMRTTLIWKQNNLSLMIVLLNKLFLACITEYLLPDCFFLFGNSLGKLAFEGAEGTAGKQPGQAPSALHN